MPAAGSARGPSVASRPSWRHRSSATSTPATVTIPPRHPPVSSPGWTTAIRARGSRWGPSWTARVMVIPAPATGCPPVCRSPRCPVRTSCSTSIAETTGRSSSTGIDPRFDQVATHLLNEVVNGDRDVVYVSHPSRSSAAEHHGCAGLLQRRPVRVQPFEQLRVDRIGGLDPILVARSFGLARELAVVLPVEPCAPGCTGPPASAGSAPASSSPPSPASPNRKTDPLRRRGIMAAGPEAAAPTGPTGPGWPPPGVSDPWTPPPPLTSRPCNTRRPHSPAGGGPATAAATPGNT